MFIDFALSILFIVASIAILFVLQLRRRLDLSVQRIASIERERNAVQSRCDDAVSKLEAILAATTDAILLCDAKGVCHLLNPQARALFSSPSPTSLLSLTRSSDLDALLQSARQSALPDHHPTIGEVQLRAFGDRAMQVLISRVTTVGDMGIDESYLILLKDVTDLRRLETVRRDFVANVSHELRTPLTSIKAIAETLLDGAIEDEGVARHFLETIVRETDRLVRLAADLLDLSRVETQPIVMKRHDIAAVVDDIANRLSSQHNKANLTLSIDVERPLMAPCDSDELAQVLLNLLDNAIKYTPQGGRVDVTGRLRDNRIVIEVSDTGIGILKQDLPRLFERFYRTDKARSRQSGGTGLGLSIVKHIVERHGGDLWVRSEYNRGSTFGFALPVGDPAEPLAGSIEHKRLMDSMKVADIDYLAVSSTLGNGHDEP